MEHLLHLLLEYKYLILFPLAIVEGPALAVVAGFLCMNKILNPFIVFPIIISGDMVGDSLCYTLGRFGVPALLKKAAIWLGVNGEKIQSTRAYFDTNPIKTISLSKIALGIGFAGIYLAGHVRIPYVKFILICFCTSVLQYIVYLGIGLLFGNAYLLINGYINLFSAILIILALSILFIYFIHNKRKRI